MNRPSLDRVAAKILADEPVADVSPPPARRAATVEAIRDALVDRRRARERRRWMVPVTAAAAFAAVVAGLWLGHRATRPHVARVDVPSTSAARAPFAVARASGATAFVVRGGARTVLRDDMALAPGDTVLAGEQGVTIELRTGTKIDVEGGSEVVLPDATSAQIVDVRGGAVVARVAKLAAVERFVVRTSDAETEVRGTVFRVAIVPTKECGSVTSVRVREGRVVVREHGAEHALAAGEAWQRACPAAVTAAASPPAPSTGAASGAAAVVRRTPPPQPAPSPVTSATSVSSAPTAGAAAPTVSSSELAAQNALYADAMAAKRRGDARAAVAALDVLVERHPGSPLREAAEAERMKLLSTYDPTRAAVAARGYAARYPNGFAAADARGVLDRSR